MCSKHNTDRKLIFRESVIRGGRVTHVIMCPYGDGTAGTYWYLSRSDTGVEIDHEFRMCKCLCVVCCTSKVTLQATDVMGLNIKIYLT
jgi:hypothetical protein